ncbi:hypothetical protein EB077_07215 [bacterium]|nr:hypothetical protein [bacterium]
MRIFCVLSILWCGCVTSEKYLLTRKGNMLVTSVGSVVSDTFGVYSVSREYLQENARTIADNFHVELDAQVHILGKRSIGWHLQRITGSNSQYYRYNTTGSCHTNPNVIVNTYILDTGIDVTHPQFGGRAKWLTNFADTLDTDCQGHGTHVAGLVGSKDYGVCVDANLFAVKVLDCNGSGSLSGVIKGIEFVYKQQKQWVLSKETHLICPR